jgi:hypothetical protein
MNRPKHPDKDLDGVLEEADAKNWKIEKGKKYFKILCPNPCKCWKTVHLSPSDPYYLRNLRGQLRRATCWDKKEE